MSFKEQLSYLKRYFSYLINGKSKYYIHSPFVYDFIVNVLDRKEYYAFEEVEALRKQLLNQKKEIEIEDFGAGSKIFKSNKRKISLLAKHVATSAKKAKVLHNIVNHYKVKRCLELGTSLGLGTLYMSKANTNTQIITIEGCKNTAQVAAQNFKTLKAENIELINDKFINVFEDLLNSFSPELIFFDGNHSKTATLKYFETALQKVKQGGIFIFDDINWNAEMNACWKEICKNEQVNLTIDLFEIGIAFQLEKKEKENFQLYF